MMPEDFPRYGDRDCPHPPSEKIRDGMSDVCGACGIIQVRWR